MGSFLSVGLNRILLWGKNLQPSIPPVDIPGLSADLQETRKFSFFLKDF